MTTEVKLNESDLLTAKENYANLIIDGMDMDCLVQFAFDSMMANMETWNTEDLKEEVTDIFDNETWENLIDNDGRIQVTYGDTMREAS